MEIPGVATTIFGKENIIKLNMATSGLPLESKDLQIIVWILLLGVCYHAKEEAIDFLVQKCRRGGKNTCLTQSDVIAFYDQTSHLYPERGD
jgi:hypothetical protein